MPASSPRGHSLATWVTAVALLALLPLLLFTVYVVQWQIDDARDRALNGLQQQAVLAATAIDRELASVGMLIDWLGQSDAARLGDHRALHELASRIARGDARLDSISLSRADGSIPWSTAAAWGTVLPASLNTALQQRILDGGRSFVTPLVSGSISGRQVVAVAAPFPVGREPASVLRITIRLEALNAMLNRQAWPRDWTASVIDQHEIIIARSHEADRYVGQSPTDTVRTMLRQGESLGHGTTRDGTEVEIAVAPIAGSGWHVAVGLPVARLNAEVRRMWAVIFGAALCCVGLGVFGAVLVSRSLGRQLQGVVDQHADRAAASGRGTVIREVEAMSQALAASRADARRAADELQRAREEAVSRLTERSEMLDVLAHEVRQPLNNAGAALQAASRALWTARERDAQASVERAQHVLHDVQASIGNTLAVAGLLLQGEPIPREDTDVDALIGLAIADMPASERARIEVERTTSTRTATMDSSLMRLALRNLLSNALKYSPPASPVTVRVSDSDEPLALILDVVDTGGGMDSATLTRALDRAGRRGRNRREARQVLGLYIVRRVMELHGGSLQLHRADAQGTTMRLVIDQARDD